MRKASWILNYCVLLTIATLLSCTPRFEFSSYRPGTCIQEINRSYASGATGKSHLYKIEEYFAKTKEYSLSIYYNNDWYYLKQRPRDYFKDGQKFAYQEVECPDGGAIKGLQFRLKGTKVN